MNYEEYRTERQNAINKLPLFFAFSDEQLQKALDERGATVEDIAHLSGTTGAFFLKKDRQILVDFFNTPDPIEELMKDEKFAYEAISYELRNYEYCYNTYQGDWDVITGLFGEIKYVEGFDYNQYLTEIEHPELIPIYKRAVQDYYEWCDEHDIW